MPATPATQPLDLGESLPQRLLDLLFPPRCVHCGSAGALLCAACAGQIVAPPAPRCDRCDRSLLGALGPRCPACVALLRKPTPPRPLERIIVAADYGGPSRLGDSRAEVSWAASAREATGRAACQRHTPRRFVRLISCCRCRCTVTESASVAIIRRRWWRDRWPARWASRCAKDALLRVRATLPQTRLDRRQRRENVAGAFALAPGAAESLAGKRIALVDDVTTTGATLEAAAEALLAARPAAIYGLAVARPAHDWAATPEDDVG